MDYQYILIDVKDRIATVTINRPEYSNAFARESYYEIADAMNTLGARDDVGVIVELLIEMSDIECYHRRRKTFLCRWRYQTF